MTTGLVIVAAGSSARMGAEDKVFADVGGKPVLAHSLYRMAGHVAHVAVVVRSDRIGLARSIALPFANAVVVAGGDSRRQSVWYGLQALPETKTVAIHDAARPFAPASLLVAGASALAGADGSVPGLPVIDTLKHVTAEGAVTATIDRSHVRAVQTPQVFAAPVLFDAHRRSSCQQEATDDAALVERCGYSVTVIDGHPDAFKITSPRDLEIARLLFAAGAFE